MRRLCPACGEKKDFRKTNKTCGCQGTNPKLVSTDLPNDYLIKENTKLVRQLEKSRLDLNSERKMRRNLARNHAGFDDLLANIREFTKAIGAFNTPVSPIERVKPSLHGGHSEDAVFVISDTHFGDRATREDSSGFPEFDLEIAGARMGYVAQKARQILAIHKNAFDIDTLYVPILGDIVHGVLHDSPQSNEIMLPAQIHFSFHMLRYVLEDMLQMVDAKIIKKVVVLFSVGNHARLESDKPMPVKLQAQRTWDWLVYQMLIDYFRDRKNIECRTTLSPFIFENIRGWRYLFAHGLGVGFKNKPERQAKSISEYIANVRAVFDSTEYRRESGLQGETFSRAVIGDVHVPMSFPHFLSNGSLPATNELGVNWRLETVPAGMTLFGVSKSHVQTYYYFLNCDKIQRGEQSRYAKFAREYARRFGRYESMAQ